MEPKKSEKADIEKKRFLFREIGYIVALALVFAAFEWTSRPSEVKGFVSEEDSDVIQENVPITRQEERKEPPPPPPPQSTEVLNIVDDEVAIEDELILEQTGADEDTRVQIEVFAETEEEEEYDDIFIILEDMPSFKGEGLNAFTRYVQRTIKYPLIAMENGIEGTVFFRFVVEKNGSVNGAEVLRGVDPVLDEAALAAVEKAPRWNPGRQRGKPVWVSCTIPILFSMD
ncbi:MAG: energy transducer TonB [Bacteroidales bacterium]